MILMIDNYDSFTYNLVQYLGELGQDVRVFRHDKITVGEAEELNPDHIVVSPGPGDPRQAGVSMDLIRRFSGEKPILGVCLGHQCIGEAFGGRIVRAPRLMHGKTSMIEHDGGGVYRGLPKPFEATRYHSLIVDEGTMPSCLEITARSADMGEIMGVRHREHPLTEGVQFHPESVLTEVGQDLLRNFLGLPITATV
ncbi:MAG: aminodeoxychorismate/anthranilate synthase component II [Armatimonadota bacterium]|nr:MAG: aminodeoxychorismate/anthranilate synthase component II [Armatimonadota bacterium]